MGTSVINKSTDTEIMDSRGGAMEQNTYTSYPRIRLNRLVPIFNKEMKEGGDFGCKLYWYLKFSIYWLIHFGDFYKQTTKFSPHQLDFYV